MPAAAMKALEGKLAEGIDPMAVIEELTAAGWTPPEGEAPGGMPEGLSEEPGDMEQEPMAEPRGAGLMASLGESKGGMNERRAMAAKSAMKKHGYEEDEE